jgi:hypothetical protein
MCDHLLQRSPWVRDQGKGLQGCGPRGKPKSHISCSWKCRRVWKNEPSHSQVSPTLGIGVRWTSKSSKSNCKGQNSMDWKVNYIIENLLELRCLKWACMTHLDTSNTIYGQKKGQELNWQFDSRPLKFWNHLDLLVCRWCAPYCWKTFDNGYNFASNLILIRGFCAKLWAPKVAGVPGQNDIWVLVPWPCTKYTIRGKVVASPQVRAMVSLLSHVNPWLLMARSCTKVLELCISQLVVWFVQVRVSKWSACQSS